VPRLLVAPSLTEALAALAADPAARPIAGGVGVMLGRALGLPVAAAYVGIGTLPELRIRSMDGGAALLGAAVTLEALADPGETVVPPLLRAAAVAAANPGIRATATLGGNVVSGGPASDLVAALVALGAEARLQKPGGERWLPVEHLVAAPAAAAGGIVTAFRVPHGAGWGFERVTVRGAMDRSAATVAVSRGPAPRVAATYVAESVVRFPDVERRLGAGDTDSGRLHAAAVDDLATVALIPDDRVSGAWRARVLPVLIARAAQAALGHRS
jgi:CO/xanthine dehydrogenase FAD-binding subunit